MTAPRRPQDRRRASKKAAAPKRSAVSASPAVFDLDSLTREAPNVVPFTFTHGGKKFTLGDPAEIDLAAVVAVSDDPMANVSLLVELLGDEQYEQLVEAGPLPQWKIPALIDAWQTHYQVDDEGKDEDSSD